MLLPTPPRTPATTPCPRPFDNGLCTPPLLCMSTKGSLGPLGGPDLEAGSSRQSASGAGGRPSSLATAVAAAARTVAAALSFRGRRPSGAPPAREQPPSDPLLPRAPQNSLAALRAAVEAMPQLPPTRVPGRAPDPSPAGGWVQRRWGGSQLSRGGALGPLTVQRRGLVGRHCSTRAWFACMGLFCGVWRALWCGMRSRQIVLFHAGPVTRRFLLSWH